jgi:hypothetical protein
VVSVAKPVLGPKGRQPIAPGKRSAARGCDATIKSPEGAKGFCSQQVSFAPPGLSAVRFIAPGLRPGLLALRPFGAQKAVSRQKLDNRAVPEMNDERQAGGRRDAGGPRGGPIHGAVIQMLEGRQPVYSNRFAGG